MMPNENIIRKTQDTPSSEQKTKHQPIVKFGLVGGYDNPQVIQCRTVEVDVGHRTKKNCKGQFCVFWEHCCMPNRVIILETKREVGV